MIRIFAGEWLRDLGIPWDSPEQGLVQTDKLLKVKGDYRQPQERKYRFDKDELPQLEDRLHYCAAHLIDH